MLNQTEWLLFRRELQRLKQEKKMASRERDASGLLEEQIRLMEKVIKECR